MPESATSSVPAASCSPSPTSSSSPGCCAVAKSTPATAALSAVSRSAAELASVKLPPPASATALSGWTLSGWVATKPITSTWPPRSSFTRSAAATGSPPQLSVPSATRMTCSGERSFHSSSAVSMARAIGVAPLGEMASIALARAASSISPVGGTTTEMSLHELSAVAP